MNDLEIYEPSVFEKSWLMKHTGSIWSVIKFKEDRCSNNKKRGNKNSRQQDNCQYNHYLENGKKCL